MTIDALAASIYFVDAASRKQDTCCGGVENESNRRHRTSRALGRLFSSAREKRQRESREERVAPEPPESLSHPVGTSSQCGTPDVLLFEFAAQAIHCKDGRYPNDEDSTEKLKSKRLEQPIEPASAAICSASIAEKPNIARIKKG